VASGESPDEHVNSPRPLSRDGRHLYDRVGFQKSVTYTEQQLYATRSYSLIKPPRMVRRLIRFWLRSATGSVGCGGRWSRARWGRGHVHGVGV
jgi:hypothetical protein